MPRLRYIVLGFTALFFMLLIVSLIPGTRGHEATIEIPVTGTFYRVLADFDYPERIWLGTTDSFNLTTRMEAITETADLLPSETVLEVKLESLCLHFEPPGDSLQAIILGKAQQWRWELTPASPPQPCELTLVVEIGQPTEPDKQVIYMRRLTIETMSFMGLSVTTVRAGGLVGSILGLVAMALIEYRKRTKRIDNHH